jgi:hypothetical protein
VRRYRNINKGANRILKFEQRGDVYQDLLSKLAQALNVAPEMIEEDRRNFFREWTAWANQPIRPYLVVRLLAAVYLREQLPDGTTSPEQAEAFASARVRHWNRCCCLVLSRRYSIWIDEAGEVYERTEAVPGAPNVPSMRLSGSRREFILRSISGGLALGVVRWPKKPSVPGCDANLDADATN